MLSLVLCVCASLDLRPPTTPPNNRQPEPKIVFSQQVTSKKCMPQAQATAVTGRFKPKDSEKYCFFLRLRISSVKTDLDVTFERLEQASAYILPFSAGVPA